MSILFMAAAPDAFEIIVAEHPRHLVRRFVAPSKVVLITIRASRRVRLEIIAGYKTEIAPVVTFHF
jgi:hypothetical protein